MPEPLPASWSVEPLESGEVRVTLNDATEFKVESFRALPVKSAGQLPTGFEPGELYNSRFHPRGLQMSVVAATDAIRSIGLPWQRIVDRVQPDEVAVFSGSIMSQLDENGFGGLMQSRLKGGRVTAKQLPLGLNTMPADFINAYVLGSVGTTGSVTGACATFLYNLQKAIELIGSGRARVALVGNAEAPINQECIDGYGAMGALATEDGLRQVGGREDVDFRRASRPFGENCGFTLAESSQYVVLMDDALALELGADIHGAVTDVFINADGFKKSISAPARQLPDPGQAVASATQLFGSETVRQHSFVHAHGSSTPANRVTESELLDRVAAAFGIESWPITAVKAFVGHSLATASGDQVVSALGTFRYGILPGIKTIDRVADDAPAAPVDLHPRPAHGAAQPGHLLRQLEGFWRQQRQRRGDLAAPDREHAAQAPRRESLRRLLREARSHPRRRPPVRRARAQGRAGHHLQLRQRPDRRQGPGSHRRRHQGPRLRPAAALRQGRTLQDMLD